MYPRKAQTHPFTRGVTAKSNTALWAGTKDEANCLRSHIMSATQSQQNNLHQGTLDFLGA